MDRMKSQAVRWGTRLIEADAGYLDLSGGPTIQVDGQTVVAHSVIVATGAVPTGYTSTVRHYWSRGISACAICDGATQFRKAELAVVGGGDSACKKRCTSPNTAPMCT